MSDIRDALDKLIKDGQYISAKEFLIYFEHSATYPDIKAPMQLRLDEAEQAILKLMDDKFEDAIGPEPDIQVNNGDDIENWERVRKAWYKGQQRDL